MTRKEMRNSLQNTKVYVAGKSKEIQKKLFELGFRWRDYSTEVQYVESPFLYIESGVIYHGGDMSYFSDSQDKEVTSDYILGLTWEEEKSKREFKPFDKVLVRDDECEAWKAMLYSHTVDHKCYPYCCNGVYYCYCIPYEGNEKLVGTSNEPTE